MEARGDVSVLSRVLWSNKQMTFGQRSKVGEGVAVRTSVGRKLNVTEQGTWFN